MVHLIIGHGEVGKALHKVLVRAYYFDNNGKSTWRGKPVDVVHICVPYSKGFNSIVRSYMPYCKLIIVHSTVPLGTCDALGVVHSPIRGTHPHLEYGIRTFVKYFGGAGSQKAALIFQQLGIKTKIFQMAKVTEAIKLWDTTQYGRLIMLEKEIYEWCRKNEVSFDSVYTRANKDYNEGYIKLNKPEVVRPYLKHREGPIGGHCVVPNAKLLGVKL